MSDYINITVDFRANNVTRDKVDYFLLIRSLILWENIQSDIFMYLIELQIHEANLTELQGEIDKYTV